MMDPNIVDVNNKIYFIGNDWFIEYTGEIQLIMIEFGLILII